MYKIPTNTFLNFKLKVIDEEQHVTINCLYKRTIYWMLKRDTDSGDLQTTECALWSQVFISDNWYHYQNNDFYCVNVKNMHRFGCFKDGSLTAVNFRRLQSQLTSRISHCSTVILQLHGRTFFICKQENPLCTVFLTYNKLFHKGTPAGCHCHP